MALNANALTTLDTAKAYLKIPLAETSMDAILEIWINSSSQMIESDCDRIFRQLQHTEIKHGQRNNIMLLREWPIVSIDEVRIDSKAEFIDSSTLIDSMDYTIADDDMSILKINGQWPPGYNNVKIIYTAGYSSIPADLEHACLWLVYWYYNMRSGGDIGKTTQTKGDETFSVLHEAPQDVKDTIQRYKRTEVPLSGALIWNT